MKRLVAVAVKGSWEGGWQPAQGNERAVIAAPIGEGERVWLEVEGRNSDGDRVSSKVLLLSGGLLDLKTLNLTRYRIVKDGSRAVEERATTVEMILANGPTST